MKKLLRILAATTALVCASGAALAVDVMTFDSMDPTLLGHLQGVTEGAYTLALDAGKSGAVGGQDLVGAVGDASICFNLTCPANGTGQFFAALNDGVPFLFREDGGSFTFKGFDASFIAAEGAVVPSTSLILVVQGYLGSSLVAQQQFNFPSAISFANYAMSAAFANTLLTEVDFIGYSCVVGSTTCSRSFDTAQFALDNLTMAPPVPEPGTYALFGLGLVGVVLARRRRATITA